MVFLVLVLAQVLLSDARVSKLPTEALIQFLINL